MYYQLNVLVSNFELKCFALDCLRKYLVSAVISMFLGLINLTPSLSFYVFYVAWKRKTKPLLLQLTVSSQPRWVGWSIDSDLMQNHLLSKASASSAAPLHSTNGFAFFDTPRSNTYCFLLLTSSWSLLSTSLCSENEYTPEHVTLQNVFD